jgi:hypothetical protein
LLFGPCVAPLLSKVSQLSQIVKWKMHGQGMVLGGEVPTVAPLVWGLHRLSEEHTGTQT